MNSRRTSRALTIVLVGIVMSLGGLPASGIAAHAAETANTDVIGTAQPVDVVILADESGSMRDDENEFVGMQQAATQIVDAEWSPRSRIAIDGFGSAPQGKPNSASIDQFCPLTALDSQNARDTLTRCAAEIQARTTQQGNNTDFAQALQQAYRTLAGSRAAGHLPIVFFMSDGVLDQGPDSSYAQGVSDPSRTIGDNAAQALITAPSTGRLAELRDIGAEIWPIGFGGSKSGEKELSLFATGGAQNGCPAGDGANPTVTPIPATATGQQEAQDFQTALIRAFAEARCAVAEPPSWSPLPARLGYLQDRDDQRAGDLRLHHRRQGQPAGHRHLQGPGGPGVHRLLAGRAGGQRGRWRTDQGAAVRAEGSARAGDPPASESLTRAMDGDLYRPVRVAAQEVGLSVVWQGELGLQFTDQQVADPDHSYTLAVQPVVRSAASPSASWAGSLGSSRSPGPAGR